MANRVSLDNVTPEQFDHLVNLLSEAVSARQVKIKIWVPSSVELLFDSDGISDLLDAKGLPVDACLSQLNLDIPIMLSGVLMGRQASAARYLTEDTQLTEPGYITEPEHITDDGERREEIIRSELLERCTILEKKVINEGLRHQYAIKTTAKNNVLTGVEWEVVLRQSDSTRDLPAGLTYATVRFILQKPPINYVRYVGMRQESETLTAILTTEEIVELRASLEEALTAIEHARQREDH